MEARTWDGLAAAIAAMTPEQRQQPIQVVGATVIENDVQECLPVVAIDTVAAFEIYKCRSSYNNRYCGDDVVLLLDGNPFAEDGAVAYEWPDDGPDIPIYGPHGKTLPEEQYSPRALADERSEGDVFLGDCERV